MNWPRLALMIAASSAWIVPPPALGALPACPAGGATVIISVDNQTGATQTVTLAATLVGSSCIGTDSISFTHTLTCEPGRTDCLTVTGLQPGIWNQQISVGPQQQFQKTLLIGDDPNGVPNRVSWTAFATVLTVDRTDDVASAPTPQCPSAAGTHTCTLRQAIIAGGSAAPPTLVQFDPAVFPAGTPTIVQLTQRDKLLIGAAGLVIDGTDANGNPSFRGDPYSRIVRLPGVGGNFAFTNASGALVGLSLQRPPLSVGAQPGDMIVFDGTSGQTHGNLVRNCKLNGGGGGLRKKLTAQDCVEAVNGAGQDWSSANLVQNTEITACPDKAVKSITRAYVKVQDSWVHHNIGGGLQATLGGNLEADRNLVEYGGYNVVTQVFPAANGLSANGASTAAPDIGSVLQTDGNIVRNNSARGISIQELSVGRVQNDLSCGARNRKGGGQNGVAVFNTSSTPAAAVIRGVAAVYNARNGATVAGQSTADFGQDSAAGRGNNAFTQNATNPTLGGHNLDNSTKQTNLPACGDQWQHCYTDPAHPDLTCDGNIGVDISGLVTLALPQPYRATGRMLPVEISSFYPSKAKGGDVVRIVGTGFNAIDPYPPGGNCTTAIQRSNTCGNPIVGNCVQYETAPGVWTPLPVQSVTPTEIVVKLPLNITCSQPASVRVQRLDDTGLPVMAVGTFCTNS